MTLSLEVNGAIYEGFETIHVERSIEDVAGQFSAQTVFSQNLNFPIKVGSKVRVLSNNIAVFTGFVEVIDINYGATEHTISIQGRDLTCDFNDSQLDGSVEFKAPITLENVIRQTLAKINITNVNIINEAGSIESYGQADIVSSRVGQSAFQFAESYARKRQVFITTDGKGNIVLARNSGISISTGIFNTLSDFSKNNVLGASVKYDQSKRFNVYSCKSQGNTSSLNFSGNDDPNAITAVEGKAVDTGIRNTRVYNFNAESSSDGPDTENRAEWEANIRRSRSMVYTVKMQGDSYDGVNPWQINRLVQVIDDFASINGALLIKSVSFDVSVQSGTVTTLELVNPDGYTPKAANRSKKSQKSDAVGNEYYTLDKAGS